MPAADALIYLSATALAQRIREKKVSAKEAVTAYLARIAEVNPRLNATGPVLRFVAKDWRRAASCARGNGACPSRAPFPSPSETGCGRWPA